MAKVEYAFPVEKIHGKVAKHHKIGFAHRAASKLNYTQAYGKRTTKYSQAEKDHYNRQNQMSPFCKTKRLKNSAHIHTEADTKTMPASVIL